MSTHRRMTSDERKALFGLYAMYESLMDFCEPLKDRMEEDQYAYRGLKSARKHIERALNTILSTLTDEEKWYVAKNSKDHETIVRPRKVVKDAVSMYVKTDDLSELIKIVRMYKCALCIERSQEERTCPLRKVMKNLIDEPLSKFGCGFKGMGY